MTLIQIGLLIVNLCLFLYSIDRYNKARRLYQINARDKKTQTLLLIANIGLLGFDMFKTLTRKEKE